MPAVSKQFQTFHSFASASLQEIYGERLDQALHVTANELRSGILINESNKTDGIKFRFKPLPPLAQVAPGLGIEIFDSNSDGHNDIFITQNYRIQFLMY